MGKNKGNSSRKKGGNVEEVVQCPHLHFKTDVIDRNVLSKEQHLNLLSTPKGYRWDENKKEGGDGGPAEELSAPRRILCSGRRMKKAEKVYVHNFLAEVWSLLTPEMVDRLKGMLMNEFGMSPQEADDFICKQREENIVNSSSVSFYKKPRDIGDGKYVYDQVVKMRNPNKGHCNKFPKSNLGVRNSWVKDFSDFLSEKMTSYVLDTMCAERSDRQQEIAQTLLNRFNTLLEQNASMSDPKTSTDKTLVVVADRLASWLDSNVGVSKEAVQQIKTIEEAERRKRIDEDRKKRQGQMRRERDKREAEVYARKLDEEAKILAEEENAQNFAEGEEEKPPEGGRDEALLEADQNETEGLGLVLEDEVDEEEAEELNPDTNQTVEQAKSDEQKRNDEEAAAAAAEKQKVLDELKQKEEEERAALAGATAGNEEDEAKIQKVADQEAMELGNQRVQEEQTKIELEAAEEEKRSAEEEQKIKDQEAADEEKQQNLEKQEAAEEEQRSAEEEQKSKDQEAADEEKQQNLAKQEAAEEEQRSAEEEQKSKDQEAAGEEKQQNLAKQEAAEAEDQKVMSEIQAEQDPLEAEKEKNEKDQMEAPREAAKVGIQGADEGKKKKIEEPAAAVPESDKPVDENVVAQTLEEQVESTDIPSEDAPSETTESEPPGSDIDEPMVASEMPDAVETKTRFEEETVDKIAPEVAEVKGRLSPEEREKLTNEVLKSVASIILETKADASPRQEALKDIMGKHLGENLGDQDKEAIDKVSSKIGTWIDKMVDQATIEYGDSSRPPPGPADLWASSSSRAQQPRGVKAVTEPGLATNASGAPRQIGYEVVSTGASGQPGWAPGVAGATASHYPSVGQPSGTPGFGPSEEPGSGWSPTVGRVRHPRVPIAQRPKGRIYNVNKSGSGFDVSMISNTRAQEKIRLARGTSPAFDNVPNPNTPMEPTDLKTWCKWTSALTEVAESWAEWIKDTVKGTQQRGEELARDRSPQRVSDWDEFRDNRVRSARQWQQTKKDMEERAEMWRQKRRRVQSR